ncbi:MAG TPA: KH domain-containing protein [Terriglobales bacterium]|jgi:uncharacterized protein|nr:KH domain-containing protein [Terriglobales bacterium]
MSEQSGDVRTLLEQIAKSLVDEPEQVSVNQIDGETTVFELTVAPEDVGKVIGRQGRVARALRALISATGIRAHKRYAVEIVE